MTRHSPLYALVLRASARVGTASRLAELVGISVSALLRGAKSGHLATDTLLAIAEAGGEDPTALLVAVGRQATADRIRRLYGKTQITMSADDRQLLALDEESKRQLCRLIEGLIT